MLTFDYRIHRLEWFAQVILISVSPTFQNLRSGLKRRQNGKSNVPIKQRGSKNYRTKINLHSFHLRKIGACRRHHSLKPEERELVLDSGASMHMISKKDLSKAEMDTLTKSCSLLIVITTNGGVQTHEEAIVHVKELDIFFTLKVLDNTPAVLSLGKRCDEHGYSYEWITGQKAHLIKNGIRIQCNTKNFGSWFVYEFFLKLAFFNILDTFKARNW